jgi:GDPmannose 4,6-dehydratase
MHKIIRADAPDDFVLATGETRSVREFVDIAFAQIGRQISGESGVDEVGVDRNRERFLFASIPPISVRPKSTC